MRTARFVIRPGLWGRTAHDIVATEMLNDPDTGEGLGAVHVARCGARLYWWDTVSDTTRPADIVCPECMQMRLVQNVSRLAAAQSLRGHLARLVAEAPIHKVMARDAEALAVIKQATALTFEIRSLEQSARNVEQNMGA